MAVTMAYGRSQFEAAIAKETTYGTPITVQGSFQKFHLTEPWQLDTSSLVIVDETPRVDGTAVLAEGDIYKTTAGARPSVTLSGVLTSEAADILFAASMQNESVSTSENTYTFTYTTTASGTPSSLFHYTILMYDPISGESKRLTSAVCSSLQLTQDAGSNGGRWTFQATFVSGHAATLSTTATPSSWTEPSAEFYPLNTITTKTIDGNAVVYNNLTFSIENTVSFYGFDSSGDAEGFAVGAGNSGKGMSASGSITVKYDDNTKALIDEQVADPSAGSAGPVPLVILVNDGLADAKLNLTANIVFDSSDYDFGNDAGVMRTLPFKCVHNGTDTAALTIVTGDNTPT